MFANISLIPIISRSRIAYLPLSSQVLVWILISSGFLNRMQVPQVALVPWEKYISHPTLFQKVFSVCRCMSLLKKNKAALVWLNHWHNFSLVALFERPCTFWDLINIVPGLAMIIYVLFHCWLFLHVLSCALLSWTFYDRRRTYIHGAPWLQGMRWTKWCLT